MSPGTGTAAAACAAAALAVAGCVLAPKFAAPRLSIVGVQLVSSDLLEQHFKVRMRVENPNARVLPVGGITYTLEVEGEPFASGESDAGFVVPAMGEAQFDMNMTTNLAGTLMRLLARGPDTLGQGVAYRLSGKVSLSHGWLRSLPFEERGSFKLQ
ncbi:MAG TPA: LEA type 2 family protein [Steroidobacteraceae bacterium]|nr:LEA type 2 family protein [Steroidobacteraceae bacterium]